MRAIFICNVKSVFCVIFIVRVLYTHARTYCHTLSLGIFQYIVQEGDTDVPVGGHLHYHCQLSDQTRNTANTTGMYGATKPAQ